ncbi:hypothetical protein BASA81_001140 [Batrachochytrium salamandrivorans]|nr:hypothetical protein BASA81_001140 [Batrachochytrium salamandrivorans]
MCSDIGLVRFLRGYANDIPQAAEAFRSGVEWRWNHHAQTWRDRLLLSGGDTNNASLETISAHYTNLSRLPHWDRIGALYPERVFQGHDKVFNPIMVTTHDMIDNVLGLLTCVQQQEYNEFRLARAVNLELYLDALSRRLGRLVKCVYVWDLAGMTRALWKAWETKHVKRFFGDFDSQLGSAFPEQVFRVVCLNVPTWLILLWSVAKRMVPGRTIKKIGVFPSNSGDPVVDVGVLQVAIPQSLPAMLTQELKLVHVSFGCTKAIEFSFQANAVFYSVHLISGGSVLVTVEHWLAGKRVHLSKPFRVEDFYQTAWQSPTTGGNGEKRTVKLLFDCRGASSFFGFSASKSLEFRAVPYSSSSLVLH